MPIEVEHDEIGITVENNVKVAVCGPSIVIYPVGRPRESITAVLNRDHAKILIKSLIGEHKINPYEL